MHVCAHTTHCTLQPCVTFGRCVCLGAEETCHQEQPESRAGREQERTGGGAGSKKPGSRELKASLDLWFPVPPAPVVPPYSRSCKQG